MAEKSKPVETPASVEGDGAQTAPGEKDADVADTGKETTTSPRESAAELYDQLLRLKADFENFRKRMDREKPEWIRIGEAGLLSRLLPLYDVLLQAHDQVLKASGAGGGIPKELMAGLEILFKEFTKIFESEGVKVIETVGKPYHHDLHEVLGSVETKEHPEGTVVEELQRGYTWHGKVLRPARVRIAKAVVK